MMNSFVNGLILICVLTSTAKPSFGKEDSVALQGVGALDIDSIENTPAETATVEDRSETTEENVIVPDKPSKSSKPLRSIFMGIYKNYKSTYLGNKTLTEYKQTLRETLKNKQQLEQNTENNEALQSKVDEDENAIHDGVVTEYPDVEEDNSESTSTLAPDSNQEANNKNQQIYSKSLLEKYKVGPALNLSLDLDNSIVKVNIDGESLKELATGRWLNDNTEVGRGKKYDMMTKILPLFILPFLIQSAIVPFIVTKLKLLLIKSMLVGKLAIFLLIISAFRNGNKMMQTYEVAPSYWAGEPSRRSELAAAASSMAYNGYRVEGKPAAWIN